MNRKSFSLLLLAMGISVGLFAQNTENWTHLRGSHLDGHSLSANAPVTWNETSNVLWKTAIRGIAWSSPVVFGDQIWTSSATDDGKELFAVCTDFNSGKIEGAFAF